MRSDRHGLPRGGGCVQVVVRLNDGRRGQSDIRPGPCDSAGPATNQTPRCERTPPEARLIGHIRLDALQDRPGILLYRPRATSRATRARCLGLTALCRCFGLDRMRKRNLRRPTKQCVFFQTQLELVLPSRWRASYGTTRAPSPRLFVSCKKSFSCSNQHKSVDDVSRTLVEVAPRAIGSLTQRLLIGPKGKRLSTTCWNG